WVLRHGEDCAAEKVAACEDMECRHHCQAGDHRDHQTQRKRDISELDGRTDIVGLDEAIVHTEHQQQTYLDDKQDAEEEHQTLHRLFTVPLEGVVIDL